MIAVMAVAAITASAQEVGKIFVTPKAGINLAKLTNYDGGKMRVGLVGGAELGYQSTAESSISIGVLYSQQGLKDGDETLKNDYLNIPIMAKYMIAPGLNIGTGLQPSILLSAKHKVDGGKVSGEVDNKDAYNTFDLSLPIVVSYEYSNVVLEARYNVGLLKCFKDIEGEYGTYESKCKNSVITFTLGYKIF